MIYNEVMCFLAGYILGMLVTTQIKNNLIKDEPKGTLIKKMTKETKEQLIKRLYSFLWRLGAFILVSGLAVVIDFLGILRVDPTIIAVATLVVGEVTKYLNTYLLKE